MIKSNYLDIIDNMIKISSIAENTKENIANIFICDVDNYIY